MAEHGTAWAILPERLGPTSVAWRPSKKREPPRQDPLILSCAEANLAQYRVVSERPNPEAGAPRKESPQVVTSGGGFRSPELLRRYDGSRNPFAALLRGRLQDTLRTERDVFGSRAVDRTAGDGRSSTD